MYTSLVKLVRYYLLTLFVVSELLAQAPTSVPPAVGGVLDLRGLSENHNWQKPVKIKGSWLYTDGWWSPDSKEERLWVEAPIDLFLQMQADEVFAGARLGSFAMTILNDAESEALALSLDDLPAYRVWANEKLLVEQGVSGGEDPLSRYSAQRGRRVVILPQTERIELLVQMIAPEPRWESWQRNFYIGPASVVQRDILRRTIILSVSLGGIIMTGLYHLALYALNRNRRAAIYLALMCFGHSIRLAQGSDVDLMSLFSHPIPFEWTHKMGFAGYYIIVVAMIGFLYESFPKTMSKKWFYFFMLTGLGFVAFTLSTTVDHYASWNWLFHFVSLAAIFAGFNSLRLAVRMDLAGYGPYIFGSSILILSLINDIFYVQNLPSIGQTAHVSMFIFVWLQSYLLSEQFQKTYHTLQHTYKELTKIVYAHCVEWIAKGQKIESTMPVGSSLATVLAFDIVESSKVKHPGFPAAVEAIMGRCYQLTMEGYDSERLCARAYRVKEMGDGLICTVGFPLPLCGGGQTQEEVALALAEDFAAIFKEEIEKLNLDHSCYCSIGITQGVIDGYFPKFGIKQYDLRGMPLALATRYEAMRNRVFAVEGRKGSVIFIQDVVYRALTLEEQKKFHHWDCSKEGYKIRDDAQAKQAWFKFVPPAGASNLSTTFSYDKSS